MRQRMWQSGTLAGIILVLAWLPAMGQDALGDFLGTITLRSGQTLQGTIKLAEFGLIYGSSIGTLQPEYGAIEFNVDGDEVSTPGRDIWAVQAEWRNDGTAEAANWIITEMIVTKKDGSQVIGKPTWALHCSTSIVVTGNGETRRVSAIPLGQKGFTPDNLIQQVVIGDKPPPDIGSATAAAAEGTAAETPAATTGTTPALAGAPISEPPATTAPQTPATEPGEQWAVLVGIGRYATDVGALKYAGSDARGLAEVLVDPNAYGLPAGNIIRLCDDQQNAETAPTVTNVVQAFTNLKRRSRDHPIGKLVFYFGGHGYCLDGETYLLDPSVTAADMADPEVAAQMLPRKSIAVEDLVAWFGAINPRQGIIILDACRYELRSGGRAAGGRDVSVEMAQRLGQLQLSMPAGLAILNATARGGRSYEWPEKGHGLFTHALLQGLGGEADHDGDRAITLLELFAYLEDAMPRMSVQANLPEQTPMLALREASALSQYVVLAWR